MTDSRRSGRAPLPRARELVARGEKPPHRAVFLIHGEIARQAAANTTRGVAEGRIVPIEVLCLRRD